jgi:hypothetical protein
MNIRKHDGEIRRELELEVARRPEYRSKLVRIAEELEKPPKGTSPAAENARRQELITQRNELRLRLVLASKNLKMYPERVNPLLKKYDALNTQLGTTTENRQPIFEKIKSLVIDYNCILSSMKLQTMEVDISKGCPKCDCVEVIEHGSDRVCYRCGYSFSDVVAPVETFDVKPAHTPWAQLVTLNVTNHLNCMMLTHTVPIPDFIFKYLKSCFNWGQPGVEDMRYVKNRDIYTELTSAKKCEGAISSDIFPHLGEFGKYYRHITQIRLELYEQYRDLLKSRGVEPPPWCYPQPLRLSSEQLEAYRARLDEIVRVYDQVRGDRCHFFDAQFIIYQILRSEDVPLTVEDITTVMDTKLNDELYTDTCFILRKEDPKKRKWSCWPV